MIYESTRTMPSHYPSSITLGIIIALTYCVSGNYIKTEIICDGDKMELSCGYHDEVIVLYSANYGRVDMTTCPGQGASRLCGPYSNLFDRLNVMCYAQPSCSLLVRYDQFESPCSSSAKAYLEIVYTCVEKRRIHDVCSSAPIADDWGYLHSPGYPEMFYADTLCSTSIITERSNARKMEVNLIYMLLESCLSDSCCDSSIQITSDDWSSPEICDDGEFPNGRVYDVDNGVDVTFRADQRDGRVGVLLEYIVTPFNHTRPAPSVGTTPRSTYFIIGIAATTFLLLILMIVLIVVVRRHRKSHSESAAAANNQYSGINGYANPATLNEDTSAETNNYYEAVPYPQHNTVASRRESKSIWKTATPGGTLERLDEAGRERPRIPTGGTARSTIPAEISDVRHISYIANNPNTEKF